MTIRVRGLRKVYRDRAREVTALDDVALDVKPGEFVALTGRSGSGKTTLLNVLGGLDRDYSGQVVLDGRDLVRLPDREVSDLRNRGIGFVFQAFHLLPHLTVIENVTLPGLFGKGERESRLEDRALQALDRVGLRDKAPVRPTRLSAGERQRVAIARAVLNRPRLLLCDEPTGNLDEATGEVVLDIFRELNGRDGATLVIATHSARVAGAAGRRVTLEQGRVVADDKGTEAR